MFKFETIFKNFLEISKKQITHLIKQSFIKLLLYAMHYIKSYGRFVFLLMFMANGLLSKRASYFK